MPVCKFCGAPFQWGRADAKWVPLIPVGEEGDLDRTHVDADGVLRSEHRLICSGYGSAIGVVRLEKPVPATDILHGQQAQKVPGPQEKTHGSETN